MPRPRLSSILNQLLTGICLPEGPNVQDDVEINFLSEVFTLETNSRSLPMTPSIVQTTPDVPRTGSAR